MHTETNIEACKALAGSLEVIETFSTSWKRWVVVDPTVELVWRLIEMTSVGQNNYVLISRTKACLKSVSQPFETREEVSWSASTVPDFYTNL